MPLDLWTAVDEYIAEQLLGSDPALEAAIAASDAAGLPPIAVTPNQGKLLELLARIHGARLILELGTLGGYSTIWLARALPDDGRLVSLERDPRYADLARANIARAGVAEKVEIRVGAALETLPQLHAEGAGPFDLIFIDADKENYPGYLEWALKLARPGTVIIGDNVVRAGAILNPGDPGAQDGDESGVRDGEESGVRDGNDPESMNRRTAAGARRFYEILAAESRLSATAIQTVGAKGHDGFALAIVGE
jgi:predicted O-methyltransferase YrrM